ncbi:hypothetical protein [Pseudobacteriovorax antillogorgiicola]|nr:hypothetical protein [Pseudobacteriovorax antillogorgiicola]
MKPLIATKTLTVLRTSSAPDPCLYDLYFHGPVLQDFGQGWA